MGLTVSVAFEALRTMDGPSVTANFTPVGSATRHKIVYMEFVNLTDKALEISFDGDEPHKAIAYNGASVWDIASNKTSTMELALDVGTSIYVRYKGLIAPTTGDINITCVYGRE